MREKCLRKFLIAGSNLFLRIAGKTAKNAKIITRKNFVPRDRIKGKGEEVCVINFAVKSEQQRQIF